MQEYCSNCSAELNAGFKFCPNCSQKTDLHRIRMHEVKHEALHYFTHADKSFFQLIKSLLLKNGFVAAEYINGKRKKYYPPLNFFLLVAAILVSLMSLMSSVQHTDILKEHPELNKIPDTEAREKVFRIYERKAEAIGFINKYSNVMSMIALPLITLIFWLFYIRGKYNYTEHLVAGMYMTGFINLVYILIFAPFYMRVLPQFSFAIFLVFLVFQIAYCTMYYYHFMAKKTTPALLKAMGVSACAILFWSSLSYYLVGLYISTGFWGLIK